MPSGLLRVAYRLHRSRAESPPLCDSPPSSLQPLTCLLTLLLRMHFRNFTHLRACTRGQRRVLVGVFLELRKINYKCGADVFSSVAEKVSGAKIQFFSLGQTILPSKNPPKKPIKVFKKDHLAHVMMGISQSAAVFDNCIVS